MASAELLVLFDPVDLAVGKPFADLLSAVTVNYMNCAGFQLVGGAYGASFALAKTLK